MAVGRVELYESYAGRTTLDSGDAGMMDMDRWDRDSCIFVLNGKVVYGAEELGLNKVNDL